MFAAAVKIKLGFVEVSKLFFMQIIIIVKCRRKIFFYFPSQSDQEKKGIVEALCS